MYPEYLYWHYVLAPRWLVVVCWRIQQAILQFFSVPLMLRTLISHWHRDVIPYSGGSMSHYINTFLMNIISRTMGFIIRTCLLAIWVVVEAGFILLTVTIIVAFMATPLFILVGFATGIFLLAN